MQQNNGYKPKAVYERSSEHTFVNPYNFVPTDFKKIERKDIADDVQEQTYTGHMECRLKCKTPIAIPGKETEPVGEGKSSHYEFFNVNGTPVIPGSSLRGVIRNVFETATDSCYSTMQPDTRLTRRNNGAFDAGLLKIDKDGKWHLYRSERYMLQIKKGKSDGYKNKKVWECELYSVRVQNGEKYIEDNGNVYKSGDRVAFTILKDAAGKPIQYMSSKKNYPCGNVVEAIVPLGSKRSEAGYLVLGEMIYNKHHDSIFIDSKEEITVDENVIKAAMHGLEVTLDMYRNPSINKEYKKTHDGYPMYQTMKKNGVIPVWYYQSETDGTLAFSMAAMGRVAFTKSLNAHVGMKAPCTSRKEMCPACRIFGMIGKGGTGEAVGSRVRFTDAKPIGTIRLINKDMPLAELGSPKPSYLPFYSTAEAEKYKGTPGYDDDGVTIRGRKFYWHSDNFHIVNKNQKETGRNACMEMADKDSEFQFRIYFECLNESQLQQLIWSVNFWNNDINGNMMHKLGHGKPIGMGSVKMTVEQVKLRSFDMQAGYEEIEFCVNYDKPCDVINMTSDTVKSLLMICNYNNRQKTRYPYIATGNIKPIGKNDAASFHWFGENKTVRKNDVPTLKVQILPPILNDDTQEMDVMQLSYPQGNNQWRS